MAVLVATPCIPRTQSPLVISSATSKFCRTTALLAALCVLFTAVFGFVVAAACGYMAGLVGSSASPISGIGIIATILMGVALLLLHTWVPAFADGVAGQAGVGLVLFMVSVILAMAAISNDNLQDLKTGYLVGATPWRQQVVLIIGCVVGAVVIPPVLNLLYHAYGFAGALPREGMDAQQVLAAPQATLMQQIAGGIFNGSLDWNMLGLGVAVGVAVIAVDVLLRRSNRGALPPLAVGLGIYLPPTIGLTLTTGAVLGWCIARAIKAYAQRGGKDWTAAAEERGLLLASGLIVGESLMGLLIAALIGFSGKDAPLALVGEGFAPAMWLGLAYFVGLCVFFTVRAEPLMRYARDTAQVLYQPQGYIDAVLNTQPRATPTNAERMGAPAPQVLP